MSTITLPPPTDGAAATPRTAAAAPPILVATDGREADASVLLTGERIGVRLGSAPQAVVVVEPIPVYDLVPATQAPILEVERAAALADLVRHQVIRETGDAWPTNVVVGPVARAIVDVAAARSASLVLLGVGRHRAVDRWLGTETALQVLREANRPVLAVGPEADGIFRRAVVAVDFGPASARAAAIACRLLAPGGMLSLVHVKRGTEPRGPAAHVCGAHGLPYANELRQRLVAALRHGTTGCEECGATTGRADLAIGTATLVGDPATELLDYAAQVGADLVAVGIHAGPTRKASGRRAVGRVATTLVRRASDRLPACSILACAPPAAPIAARMARDLFGADGVPA